MLVFLGGDIVRFWGVIALVILLSYRVQAGRAECKPYQVPDYSSQYEDCVGEAGSHYQSCLNLVASEELVEAALQNNLCWAQDVLQRYDIEPDVNWVSRALGFSALYFASVHLNPNLMQLLLNNGAMLCGEPHRYALKQLNRTNPLAENYLRVKQLLTLHHANLCEHLRPT